MISLVYSRIVRCSAISCHCISPTPPLSSTTWNASPRYLASSHQCAIPQDSSVLATSAASGQNRSKIGCESFKCQAFPLHATSCIWACFKSLFKMSPCASRRSLFSPLMFFAVDVGGAQARISDHAKHFPGRKRCDCNLKFVRIIGFFTRS